MAEEFYTVEIGGLTRHLPLVKVADHTWIAVLNLLGDPELVQRAAILLEKKIPSVDVLMTVESKSIALLQSLAEVIYIERGEWIPYVVLRKQYKTYMGQAVTATSVSMTTQREQIIYLDEKDRKFLEGKRVAFVDDVISTGSTLSVAESILAQVGGQLEAKVAVFTEGEERDDVICFGNLPVFYRA